MFQQVSRAVKGLRNLQSPRVLSSDIQKFWSLRRWANANKCWKEWLIAYICWGWNRLEAVKFQNRSKLLSLYIVNSLSRCKTSSTSFISVMMCYASCWFVTKIVHLKIQWFLSSSLTFPIIELPCLEYSNIYSIYLWCTGYVPATVLPSFSENTCVVRGSIPSLPSTSKSKDLNLDRPACRKR